MGSKPFIQTYTGLRFEFVDPQPHQIAIEDIAYSLANTPRWGAHSRPIISVGRHSLLVSQMLLRKGASPMVQLQGLMHDAAEAYLGDMPSPIKAILPDFQAIELIVEHAIFQRFNIDYPMDPQVKLMDGEALRWEYRDFMEPMDMVAPPNGPRASLNGAFEPLEVESQFLLRFHTLRATLYQEERVA